MLRRFEFVGDGSSKFWEISRDGLSVTTHWGRIGTKGQSLTKDHETNSDASASVIRQVRGKLAKGYIEPGGPPPPPPPRKRAAPEPKPDLGPPAALVTDNQGDTFELREINGSWVCNCPVWQGQIRRAESDRTCRHIKRHLRDLRNRRSG